MQVLDLMEGRMAEREGMSDSTEGKGERDGEEKKSEYVLKETKTNI